MGKQCHSSTFEHTGNGTIICRLCPFYCDLKPNQSGVCRVRSNRDDTLVLDSYGLLTVPVLDRIQKRPIYLYPNYPLENESINSLTIGSVGCNNRCPFCQNWEISQASEWEGLKEYTPQDIVNYALKHKVDFISFSFNEPIIIYEYIQDVYKLIKKLNLDLKICLKTAGYINKDFCEPLIDMVDVFNVDIKPMAEFYEKKCGILNPEVVLSFIEEIYNSKKHLEISHILIEGVNDNEECMSKLLNFIRGLDSKIGIHLLRHYPAWKSEYPVTKNESLEKWGNYLRNGGLENVFTNDVG